jgi:hypothetical protein
MRNRYGVRYGAPLMRPPTTQKIQTRYTVPLKRKRLVIQYRKDTHYEALYFTTG